MVGFTNDMVQTIAEDQGFRAHVFEVGTNALFDGIDIEIYDAVLSSLTPNVINRNKYTFSDPFYLVGPVLVIRIDSQDRSLEDMAGKIIGIESGALQVLNIPESPVVVMIPYDTASEALENLYDNVIDGVILDALRAYVYTEGYYAGQLKVVSSPLTEKGLRLISRKDPPSILLVSRFNEGLKKIIEDGVFEKLINKWDLTYTEVKREELMEESK